jgi:hypothetical protein
MPLLHDHIRNQLSTTGDGSDVCIVSPDAGGAKRAETLAKKLGADLGDDAPCSAHRPLALMLRKDDRVGRMYAGLDTDAYPIT